MPIIEHLWSGPRAPAKIYLQESGIPVILTYAVNGRYRTAMQSEGKHAVSTAGPALFKQPC